jgi:hypothetical protein
MHLQCCFVGRHKGFIDFYYEYFKVKEGMSRSRQPHGLTHGSAAARLLGLWVRIPPGGMDVCVCVCVCVSVVCCQVEASALGWSLVQRSAPDCGVSECDRESSILRRPWPTGGLLRHGREEDEEEEKEEDGARCQHYNSHLVYLVQQLHQNYPLHSADMTCTHTYFQPLLIILQFNFCVIYGIYILCKFWKILWPGQNYINWHRSHLADCYIIYTTYTRTFSSLWRPKETNSAHPCIPIFTRDLTSHWVTKSTRNPSHKPPL